MGLPEPSKLRWGLGEIGHAPGVDIGLAANVKTQNQTFGRKSHTSGGIPRNIILFLMGNLRLQGRLNCGASCETA